MRRDRGASGRVPVESRTQHEREWEAEHDPKHRSTKRKAWWAGTGLNRRHQDFQSCALPTELPAHHEVARIPEGAGPVYELPPQVAFECACIAGRTRQRPLSARRRDSPEPLGRRARGADSSPSAVKPAKAVQIPEDDLG